MLTPERRPKARLTDHVNLLVFQSWQNDSKDVGEESVDERFSRYWVPLLLFQLAVYSSKVDSEP